jgi:hypothetical protein
LSKKVAKMTSGPRNRDDSNILRGGQRKIRQKRSFVIGFTLNVETRKL